MKTSELIERLGQLPDDLDLFTLNIDLVNQQFTRWNPVGVAQTGEVIQEFSQFLPFGNTEWIDVSGNGLLEEELPAVSDDTQEVGSVGDSI